MDGTPDAVAPTASAAKRQLIRLIEQYATSAGREFRQGTRSDPNTCRATGGYSVIDAPFPARDYLVTLQVREIAGRQAAMVVWSGSFSADDVRDDAVTSLFHGIYRAGLDALALRLQPG